jgi:hypothetical protein
MALVLSSEQKDHPQTIVQELDPAIGQALRGKEVTVGTWLRSAAGSEGSVVLRLDDGAEGSLHRFELGPDWQFCAIASQVDNRARSVALLVTVVSTAETEAIAYLDGLVLAEGNLPVDSPPDFDTGQARHGTWQGRSFENLLENASAERPWPALRPWLGNRRVFAAPAARVFHSAWDWHRTSWVYGQATLRLIQSFWGRFGWSHLILPVPWLYATALFTFLGILGLGVGLYRRAHAWSRVPDWKRGITWLLGLALLMGWGGTVLRVHPVFVANRAILWPVARYAATVIAPTSLALCWGLLQLVPTRWQRALAWLGLLGMIALDVGTLSTLLLPHYYYSG